MSDTEPQTAGPFFKLSDGLEPLHLAAGSWPKRRFDDWLNRAERRRDAVGETLRKHHLEGRLDIDEFQARLDRCLAAKTYAERELSSVLATTRLPFLRASRT